MRVVGGRLRSRTILAPLSSSFIRPTSDRLRESLFNILGHRFGSLEGLSVLDLFAGTGALGIEALSRGANIAVFVDSSKESTSLIYKNLSSLGLSRFAFVLHSHANRLGYPSIIPPFDLVLADPPYGKGLAEDALLAVVSSGLLADKAIIILEEALGVSINLPKNFILETERYYASTAIRFYRVDACS
jgi:16S rRNA (guanine966-N2)-methyltransferase